MNVRDLHREISRATGESVSTIAQMGFGLATPELIGFDPEPSELERFLDWDEVDATRPRLLPC